MSGSNSINNSSNKLNSQPTLKSGPNQKPTMTTFTSPSPQAATFCNSSPSSPQRSNNRPSPEARHAAAPRVGSLQPIESKSKSADISRKKGTPNESARARAVSRFRSGGGGTGESGSSMSGSLSGSLRLTNELLGSIVEAQNRSSSSGDGERGESGESESLERTTSLEKKLRLLLWVEEGS